MPSYNFSEFIMGRTHKSDYNKSIQCTKIYIKMSRHTPANWEKLHMKHVRPITDYAPSVWDTWQTKNIHVDQIEIIQHRA